MQSQPVIFLSSTVDDMQEERNAVSEVIIALKQKISRCEFFAARTESPEQVCLNEATNCDIFVGIYKDRYGFVPTENNHELFSVTEMEYNAAKKAKKPILIFIHKDATNRDSQLDFFLKKISHFSKGHFRKEFQDKNELK